MDDFDKKLLVRCLGLAVTMMLLYVIGNLSALVSPPLVRGAIRTIDGGASVGGIAWLGAQSGYNIARIELGQERKLLPWRTPRQRVS